MSEPASGRVVLYRVGSTVAQLVPAPVGVPLGATLARLVSYAMPAKRQMLARHMQRASDGALDGAGLRREVSRAFGSYGRYWYELLALPHVVREGLVERRLIVEGFDQVEESVARGNGTILALPHLGGWEYAGPFLTARGHRALAVAEPLDPPELFDWFVEVRAEMGIDVVPLGPRVGAQLGAALRANRIVTLVCDRDLTGDGVEVEFFGERTTVPAGPATLAFRTGATILPVAVYFSRGLGHRAVIRPPVPAVRQGRLRDDVAAVTQALVHELELLIRRRPEQWHLLQPNWPSDREAA